MLPSHPASKLHVIVQVVALASVFILDLSAPHGVGIAMLYATLVLLAGWWMDRRALFMVAGVSTILVLLPLLISDAGVTGTVLVMNHFLAMATIWITCAMVLVHKQREEKVKRLTGLLPMCSFCKKVRDDKGLWSQVEQYFEEHHADLQFTHGLCPACSKQLYPELFPKLSERHPEVYK